MEIEKLLNIENSDREKVLMIISNNMDLMYKERGAVSAEKWDKLTDEILAWNESLAKNEYPNSMAKKVLLHELEEQGHPEDVEDVIFWALEHYAQSEPKETWGRVIAFAIKAKILEAEKVDKEEAE
jgi:hypothetical protein